MKRQLTLFIDTNVFLHYPPISDVRWQEICNAQAVNLKLCMQVIHELDSKKDDPNLSKRAKRALDDIKRARADSGRVRDGVTLSVFPYEIQNADFPDTLSPDSKDDRIVHSVKKYIADTGDDNVAVCTEDFGMSLRCEAHRIAVVEPDRTTRLETPQSHDQKENKRLQVELSDLKTRLPELVVEVIPAGADGDPLRRRMIQRVVRRPEQIDVDSAIERERRERELPPRVAADSSTPRFEHAAASYNMGRRERYEEELKHYLIKYRSYVVALNEFNAGLGDVFRFRLRVANTGRSPAEDVDVIVNLPPVFRCVVCEDEVVGGDSLDSPKAPTPPEKPASLIDSLSRPLKGMPGYDLIPHRMPDLSNLRLRGEPSFSLKGSIEQGVVIRLMIPRLLHFKDVVFDDFFAMFHAKGESHPFQANVEITAGNTPKKSECTIPFVFCHDEDGTTKA